MANLADTFAAHGSFISAPDGACLFQPGDESQAFLILRSGTVRVEQTNAEGRTVVLYRVEQGESCVLTTSCLRSNQPYSGYGYAEGDVTALAIGAEAFRRLLNSDPEFREMVFGSFVGRVSELIDVIDALLLHRIDTRLATWLARRGTGPLEMTQQEIAQEIGTAREVVSRALKSFEREGWLTLGRGFVDLRDPDALQSYAKQRGV